jgi:hypothetical protein
MDVCYICKRHVKKPETWHIVAPCCGSSYHVRCMVGSIFAPSGAQVFCAKCTEPKPPQVVSRHHKMESAKERHAARCKKSSSSRRLNCLDKLHNYIKEGTGKHIYTEKKWCEWAEMERDATGKVEFLLSAQVGIGTLLSPSMGWHLFDVHDIVTTKWSSIVRLGFTADTLQTLVPEDVDSLIVSYGVTADIIVSTFGRETIPIQSINSMTPRSLSLLGFTAHMLCTIGLTKTRIRGFSKVSLEEWFSNLEFREQHIELLRMRQPDFDKDGALNIPGWTPESLIHMVEHYQQEESNIERYKKLLMVPIPPGEIRKRGIRKRSRRRNRRRDYSKPSPQLPQITTWVENEEEKQEEEKEEEVVVVVDDNREEEEEYYSATNGGGWNDLGVIERRHYQAMATAQLWYEYMMGYHAPFPPHPIINYHYHEPEYAYPPLFYGQQDVVSTDDIVDDGSLDTIGKTQYILDPVKSPRNTKDENNAWESLPSKQV